MIAKLYKRKAEKRYNNRVKPRSFLTSDLVLRKYGGSEKDPSEGKLAATWEGPFRDTKVLENEAYQLEHLSDKAIPRTWNITHLKFYYS